MAITETLHVANWGMNVGISDSGSTYENQCVTCGQKSGMAVTAEGPDTWCLRHAQRTGHTEFRGSVTTFFRASLAKGPR
ncbi:hypothetical protein ACIQU6_01465 [Streptomyces sp. NPDC090442]|uniref:DUF7848 domain-containing protein n=1 Tax=Streptomyces sp. NPDC090442 TaxID=3365962 RepID=UPI0038042F8C